MVLDELHELIEMLQGRIDEHAPALQQSEALTRYALIDPLLRGLGWDTGDPSQVLVEYRLPKGSQKGYADYALFGGAAQPLVIVEAKSLHSSLEEAAAQALGYCNVLGIPHFAVTDGERWRLFETFRPVALDKKLVVDLNLKGNVAETCLNALALWRPGVAAGNVKTGAAPVVDEQAPTTGLTAPLDITPKPSEDGQWHQLSEFTPKSGTMPRAVRLPDESEADTRGWGDFIAEIGAWLYENSHLKEQHLPIQRSQNSYVVAKAPVNPKGMIGLG